MQYADTNAFRLGNTVVIHQPHRPAKTYSYDNGKLIAGVHERELEQDALAHLLWADTMYREHRYRLPQDIASGSGDSTFAATLSASHAGVSGGREARIELD